MASLFLVAAAVAHNATTGAAHLLEGADGASGAAVRGLVDGAVTMPATPSATVVDQGAALLGTATAVVGNATSTVSNATSAMTSAAATASSSALGQSGFSWGGYFQAIGVLLVLLGVLWGAVWLMRKYGKFNFMPRPGGLPRDALRLEAQLPLGPRKGLMVVRFLNKRLLLGVTDHQITLLTESTDHHDEINSTEFKDIFEEEQRQKTDA